MTTTLFRHGRVYGGSGPATALAVEDGRIAYVGHDDGASAFENADEVVELHGRLVTPAFVDAHVHTIRTGFRSTQLDLTGLASLTDVLDALSTWGRDRGAGALVIGQNWDETTWPEGRPPSGAELERAAPGVRAMLTRVDGHSAIVSPSLAGAVPGLTAMEGFAADGRVERTAHHAVRDFTAAELTDDDLLDAARAACQEMAAAGIASFHEAAAPHIGPERELDLVRQAAEESGLRATLYWGELGAVEKAHRLGVAGLAGDLVADGAFGSRTAALSAPYADRPDTCGHAYVTPEQVRDHVVACTRAGLQAGFHAIGDAALDAIAEGFEQAAAGLGVGPVAQAGHRLEHVEMPSERVIATMARLGVVASVQPMFDALWGGPDGMYAARLGDRWRGTIPLRALHEAGVGLALGSDSPVTSISPWDAVRAAAHHHDPDQRLPVAVAFRAHTHGSAVAGRDAVAGVLAVGRRADLAVWDTPAGLVDGLPDLAPGAPVPSLCRLVARGRTLQQTEEVG
ncbi:MAG: amidohydrolase [Nocardioides sp.]